MKIDALDTNKEYKREIENNIEKCLTQSKLDFPIEYQGKVRDRINLGESFAFVTTDRQSAFDRILAAIPFKGQVLNQTAAWWFMKTKHIISNHIIEVPDPNVTIAQKARPFPIEFVVRGYITGTSNTSLWTQYEGGKRKYCGITFPDGLKKNSKLEKAVITPTTKEENHDRPIAPKEIIDEKWMSQEDWDIASEKALQLFKFGQETAAKNGLVLVDTKYEMGVNANGDIIILDELHTPDSSRFWIADDLHERISKGQEPQNIDKEFLRIWFKNNCNPYEDKLLPPAPHELVVELSSRYIFLFEKITGQKFKFETCEAINQRMNKNIHLYLHSQSAITS
jgi:phosphoribosylaminoimidazole-succinocarboxamide synthase